MPDLVRAMCDQMAHRGPDDEGTFTDGCVHLGVRRLSIIDLEGGHQPIVSPNRRLCLALNGEIYNYVELARELCDRGYQFRTRTDTETLLHGYSAWGLDGLLQRLNGMFAFCLYDQASGRLILARDRTGEKPLYYASGSDYFVFASELGALVHSGLVSPEVNRRSLARYLRYQYAAGSESILSGVSRLPPGHFLVLDVRTRQIEIQRYWRPRPGDRIAAGEWQHTLRHLLTDSVRLRLRADVRVGAFLSGGVDSSINAALMVAAGAGNVDTFSVGFEHSEFDESPYSRLMADHLGTRHHHVVLTPAKATELLPSAIAAMDEPIADQAAIPTYWLCAEAKRSVGVALTGEGADELFAGYDWYAPFAPMRVLPRIWRSVRTTVQSPWRSRRRERDPVSGFEMMASVDCVESLLSAAAASDAPVDRITHSAFNGRLTPLLRAQLQDLTTWLPDDLLVKADRMSMAHGLELRAPYLDHRVIEFSLNLPDRCKIHQKTAKAILRETFADLLPPAIVARRKQGFDLPLRRWLRGELRELVRDTLSSSAVARDGTFVAASVDRVVSDFMERRTENGRLVFALYVFQEWWRHLTTKKGSRPARLTTALM